MTTQVVRGSKAEIADIVAHTPGRILEAILIVEEPVTNHQAPLTDEQFDQLLKEMDAQSVSVGGADFSRQSIYTRLEGE